MQYYYVADFGEKSAVCVNSLSEAKKMAFEKKSLIYTNKKDLPEWVSSIGGFCHATLRRSNGKFTKKFSQKYFNEDIKNS